MSDNLLLLFITFMLGIYNYIPEPNHVSRACSVAAIPLSQLMAHLLLFPHLKCIAVLHQYFPQYVCGAQYSSFLYFLDLVLPGMLLGCFLGDSEMISVVPGVLVSLLFLHYTCALFL
jgi:hypothetical protein